MRDPHALLRPLSNPPLAAEAARLPEDHYLRIANGKGESSEDRTRVPGPTVYTADTVWVGMVHGQLDDTRALEQGL